MPFVSEKLEVPAKDRAVLEGWLRAPSTPQRLAMRARVILASSDGERYPFGQARG
jgi:hypothetical protein